MQDLVTKYLEKFKRERRSRRRLGSALLALALIVTIVVYWQLKLTGAALTNETYCGKTEHTHSEECYEWVLVCGYDDVTESSVTLEELEQLWEEYDGDMEAAAAAMESAEDVSGDIAESTEETAETTGSATETKTEDAEETARTTDGANEPAEAAAETEPAEEAAGTAEEVTEPTEETAGITETAAETETVEEAAETTELAAETETTEETAEIETVEETAGTTESAAENETVEEADGTAEEVTESIEETAGTIESATENETVEESGGTFEEAAETTATTEAEVLGANIEDAAAADGAEVTEDTAAAADSTTTTVDSTTISDVGSESSSTHVHTAACYQKVLTCTLEEHTHTAACLSDVTADVETSDDWEATLPEEISDDWAKAVTANAKSQLGYTESTLNFTLADDGETLKGYTRYGAWAGNEYGDWSAMFASFCLSYAGISTEDFPESTGAYAWVVMLQESNLYAEAAEYTPEAGDLVFFDTNEDGRADSVGIIISVGEETLTVIEGDYTDGDVDAVCENEYSISDTAILGYGMLPENSEDGKYTLTYRGADYIVKVSYNDDAGLPENVELAVSEYDKESEEYQSRYAEAAKLYGWVADYTDAVRLFNIGLYVDGEEVEPAEQVKVSITFLEQTEEADEDEYAVVHFGEESTEQVETVSEYENGEQTVSFELDGFSDVATINLTATNDQGTLGSVLDGDYAYLTDVSMVADDTTESKYSMRTGTASWDDDDTAGNDSTDLNNILRTYDIATYTVTFTSRTRDDAPYKTYETGTLYFEFILEGSSSEVQFETGSMGWLTAKKDAKYYISEETIDGKTCQVLRGSYTWEPSDSSDHAIGESTQELTLAIRALALTNGDTIQPKFTFFLDGNDVGVDYTDWGTSSYSGGVVTGSGNTCSEHSETEYQTITAPEITVSARASYNVAIVSASTSKCQSVGTFDFSTGNDLALNKDAGEVYGRMGAYGIIIQIVELSSGQGLKGVELPKSGEDITFDLSLTSSFSYTDSNGKKQTISLSDNSLSSAYTPLIWSFDANLNGTSQQDGRTLSTSTTCADTAPLNELGTTRAYYYNSCYNGGNWSIAQNSDGTYTVTISGCEVDMSQIPFTNQAGNVNSTTYYVPANVNNYWEIGTACISAGEMWIVQPFYEDENSNAGDTSDTYIVDKYGDGTFTTILSDTSLSMTTESGTTLDRVTDNSNQAVKSDDSVSQSMAITKPGTISQSIQYADYTSTVYNDPLTDGCWGTGDDWILVGGNLGINGWISHDSAEGGYTGVAYDALIKFDDTFFEPEKVTANAVNGGTVTVMYAAKSDKSGWNHNGLKPNEDGYDTEMIYADIDDLVYFSSLTDLKEAGYTCVGILLQYRGLVTEQMNHIHYYIKGSCKSDVAVDYVYMVTHCCRVWNRQNLANASGTSLSDILSMTNAEVNALVNTYIPTATQSDSTTPATIDYSGNYPSDCYWINGGTDGEVGYNKTDGTYVASQSDNIRSYTKPYYNDSGYVSQTEGTLWGDSCLVVGYTSNVTLNVAQTTSGGAEKSSYDMDTNQRTVDYAVQGSIIRNNGTFDTSTTQQTTVTMTVTLPKGLSYLEGSSYIGGTYTSNGEGVQGTVTGGTQLKEGKKVTYTDEDGNKVAVTLTIGTDADGNTTLTYIIEDYTIGSDATEYLEKIYFSCTIGTAGNETTDVQNNESLVPSVTIETTEDCNRKFNTANGNYAETGILISKNSAISLVKSADQSVVDVGDDMGFTMTVGNNGNSDLAIVAVDALPYQGDAVSSFTGDVVVSEFSVTSASTADLSKLTFYYTTEKKYQGITSVDITATSEYLAGSYFTESNGWYKLNLTETKTPVCGYEEGSGHAHTDECYEVSYVATWSNDFQPTAIVAVGTLSAGTALKMHITIQLPDAKEGEYITNTLTRGNLSSTARCRTVNRTLSGLAWVDLDGDGYQDSGELTIGGVKVELLKLMDGLDATVSTIVNNINNYEAVCYTGTTNPIVISTGQQIDVLRATGATDTTYITDYTAGNYLFMNLSAGTYAVRFTAVTSDGATITGTSTSFVMADYVASPVNASSDDAKDSDATPTYSSYTLTQTVILGIEMPEASELEYSTYSSPNHDSGFFQYQLQITKVDTDNASKLLEGVEFKLEKLDDSGEVDSNFTALTGTTDSYGIINFGTPSTYQGLTAGGYILTETKAKAGYNNLSETITITIGTDGTITATGTITGDTYITNGNSSPLLKMTVTNGAGYDLPNTGGIGTELFTVMGLALCGLAGSMLLKRRKRCA